MQLAKFEGDCARCPNPIRRGQHVVLRKGLWIHAGCAAGSDDQ